MMESAPFRFRVMTWNLWHGLNPYGRFVMKPMQSAADHRRRLDAQEQSIISWREGAAAPAIFCFQEVNPLSERFERLTQVLGGEGGACLVNSGVKVGHFGIPMGLQEGLAIVCPEEMSEPRLEQLTLSGSALEIASPEGRPWVTFQLQERRKALLAEVAWQGLRLAVVNLHLHHGPDSNAENLVRKRAELERLIAWLSSRETGWDAVLVCGDFNCDVGSPCLEPLLAHGFVDTAELAGARDRLTWVPNKNPLSELSARLADTPETRAWDGGAHGFDRVYIKAAGGYGARAVGHGILSEPGLSDHYALWTELELSPGR